jgi:hypothetical protein
MTVENLNEEYWNIATPWMNKIYEVSNKTPRNKNLLHPDQSITASERFASVVTF